MANTKSISLVRASSQYARVTNNLGLGNGDFTFEAWVKPSSTPSSGDVYSIVGQGNDTVHIDNWLNYQNSAGTVRLNLGRVKQGVQDAEVYYTVTLSTSVWTHVVGIFDSGNSLIKIYTAAVGGTHSLNASAAANSGNGSVANDSGDAFMIGTRRGPDTSYFDGLIDDVRVWSDIRTTTELDDNDETELVGNEANLIAYYKLNDNVNDSTASAFNLTASGSPTYSTDIPFGAASGPTNLKSYNTNLKANIKSINTNAIANVKSLDTNA